MFFPVARFNLGRARKVFRLRCKYQGAGTREVFKRTTAFLRPGALNLAPSTVARQRPGLDTRSLELHRRRPDLDAVDLVGDLVDGGDDVAL